MKLSLAILASTAALASGKRSLKDIPADMSNVQIKAESKTGNRLLSKARRLDGDGDITWIAGYSIKFQHCTSFQDYYNGNWQEYAANYNYNQQNNQQYNENYQNYQNGGEQYQNYNQNQNQDGNMDYYNGNQYANNGNQDYQGMYQQHLVHFKLCPSDSCFRCKNGADYVVELEDFIQATLDAKLSAQEYACEKVKDNCYCDNAYSEDQCLYSCYTNAKLTECANAMYEEEFDMEDAIQCTELETDDEDAVKQFYYQSARNGDMAYYGEEEEQEGSMYVGPYCSKNGKNIYLGVFREETCSVAAPAGIYEATHYGDNLKYSDKSIVDSGCISCKEPTEVDYQNYWDQQDADEVTDVCENLYEIAGKCEEGLDGYFPYRDNSGCSYIKTLNASGIVYPKANVSAKVFAGIFGVTTAVLATVSMYLWKTSRRQNVSLAGDAIIS